jgi:hypothetical protein
MNAAEISSFAIPAALVVFKLAVLALATVWSVHAVFGMQRPDYNSLLVPQPTQPTNRK